MEVEEEEEEEEGGWRALALRAGLVYPRSRSRPRPRPRPRPRLSPEHSTPLLKSRLPSFTSVSPSFSSPALQHSDGKGTRSLSLFSEVAHVDSEVQLSGTHPIGLNAILETVFQGSRVQLGEFRSRLVKRLVSPSTKENRRLWQTAQLALSFATDFQYRHRLTLESTMGSKEDKHTLSSALSSDFLSQIAWGLATSHRLGKNLTLFSRFSRDDYAGDRFVFQAVHELNARNRVSTLYAATMGSQPQAGFSWIHQSPHEEEIKESLQLKALCAGDGTFSLSIKAQVGVVE